MSLLLWSQSKENSHEGSNKEVTLKSLLEISNNSRNKRNMFPNGTNKWNNFLALIIVDTNNFIYLKSTIQSTMNIRPIVTFQRMTRFRLFWF